MYVEFSLLLEQAIGILKKKQHVVFQSWGCAKVISNALLLPYLYKVVFLSIQYMKLYKIVYRESYPHRVLFLYRPLIHDFVVY